MGAFKSENGFIYADAPFMEFYVPTYYFDNKWAIPRGEQLRVFGVFNVGLYEGDKLKEIKSLNLPMFILINTYEQDIRNTISKDLRILNVWFINIIKVNKLCKIPLL